MFLTYQRACGMALRGAHRRRWVKGATAMARANDRFSGVRSPPSINGGPTSRLTPIAVSTVRAACVCTSSSHVV